MKKIISCLILCAMLLAIIPVSVSADVTADETWYNTTDKEFVISDAADLAAFDAALYDANTNTSGDTFEGKTVKLAANIDMSDVAWSGTRTFKGTFDGQGYTLSNLTVSSTTQKTGFFGVTQGTVVIENLTLTNISVTLNNAITVGGVVGQNNGNLQIFNVHVNGNVETKFITSAGGQNAGGFVGAVAQTSVTNIEHSSFSGTVKAQLFVGGILGRQNSNSTVSIISTEVKNATLYGSTNSNTNGSEGGLLGILEQKVADTTSYLNVHGCAVENVSLQINDDYTKSKTVNGGLLAGRIMSNESNKGKIEINVSDTLLQGSFSHAGIGTSGAAFGYVNSSTNNVLTNGDGVRITMTNTAISVDANTTKTPEASVLYLGAGDAESVSVSFSNVYTSLSSNAIKYNGTAVATVTGNVTQITSSTDFTNMTTFVDVGEALPRPVALYVNLVGYQTKANGDGTSNARLIFGIDDVAISALSSVGAYISIEGNSAAPVSCDKVYKTITGGGITYSAEALGADYLYAIVIQNIDSDVTDFDAVINPCFTKSGVEYKNGNTSSANFVIKNS